MPEVKQSLDRVGTLIKSVGALLAMLPGAAILVGLVTIPTALGDWLRFACSIIGIVCILAVLLLRDQIRTLSNRMAVILILPIAGAGIVCSSAYVQFAESHIVESTDTDTPSLLLPVRPSPQLAALLEPYDNDYREALSTSVQRKRIEDLIDQENASSKIVLSLLLIASQGMIIFSVVFGAWKIADA